MKNIHRLLLVLALLSPAVTNAADALRVVATIPDLADMTRQVGGDLVNVTSLATGVEDIHAVPMKPSFAVTLNRADVVVLVGLDAEHAFLPALLEAARNPKIQRDQPGYIDCSAYVSPLAIPSRIDRSLGEQHLMGNPHFNLDPVRGKAMVRAITEGLSKNAPQNAATFERNADAYLVKLDAAIARWKIEAAPLGGKKFVSYHADLVYFAERFGMEAFGTIQTRPGIDPTPSHVAELEEAMKKAGVEVVVREKHSPASLAEAVARRTGAKLVELPVMVGGVPEAKDYVSFIDYNLRTLVRALQDR